MSSNTPKNTPASAPLPPETQAQRWIKYGSNVALAVVLTVVLAAMLIWVAQKASARVDTTTGGSLSLKPQTLQVLKDLKQHITLVSLYVRTDPNQRASNEDSEVKIEQIDYATRVADLLDEYKRNSGMIDVKIIDPVKEKDKLEELHRQFITKYGSQIKSYTDFLAEWKTQTDQIQKLLGAEGTALAPFANSDPSAQDDDQSFVTQVVTTISRRIPENIKDSADKIDRELKRTHPDYKAAVTLATDSLKYISNVANSIITEGPKAQAVATIPAAFRQYLTDSAPRYTQIKKLGDDLSAKADKLGDLKVDQLEQALNVDNPVLVLGDKEWRVLSASQIWQQDTDAKAMANGAALRPRFAGEQQVTTAIYTLDSTKKPKVCFVRPGGQPLASAGFPPFVQGGPLSIVADRLREYNFDVTEKDLSGQWAMQAQMQRMPSAPEPSDDDIKDAVWVFLNFANEQQQPGSPPPAGAAKLAEHLKQGGSALVLVEPRSENLAGALAEWGVEIHPEAIAVHEAIKLNDAASSDPLEEAKARPYIFDIRSYGDHIIAKPEVNLDSIFVPIIPVKTIGAPGAKATPLLPLDKAVPGLKVWGETDIDSLSKDGNPTFNAEKGDLPSPLFGGAAVEKGTGRLVVIGSASFAFNRLVRFPDPNMARRGVLVSRFPGNLELATNSIFWLAKLDPMIAISPTAMDVSRIGDVGPGMLRFWRVGVLMVLLPGLVIAAGLGVYSIRKD